MKTESIQTLVNGEWNVRTSRILMIFFNGPMIRILSEISYEFYETKLSA